MRVALKVIRGSATFPSQLFEGADFFGDDPGGRNGQDRTNCRADQNWLQRIITRGQRHDDTDARKSWGDYREQDGC